MTDVDGLIERHRRIAVHWHPVDRARAELHDETATALATLRDRAEKAEAERDDAIASAHHANAFRQQVDELTAERDRLREALLHAKQDLYTIRTLNSHGADDKTYIGWLRNNAQSAEERINAALNPEKPE